MAAFLWQAVEKIFHSAAAVEPNPARPAGAPLTFSHDRPLLVQMVHLPIAPEESSSTPLQAEPRCSDADVFDCGWFCNAPVYWLIANGVKLSVQTRGNSTLWLTWWLMNDGRQGACLSLLAILQNCQLWKDSFFLLFFWTNRLWSVYYAAPVMLSDVSVDRRSGWI